MAQGSVAEVIERLLEQSKVLSTREVATEAGVSRQAAQKQLKALVASGTLTREGRARAARYFRRAPAVGALWAKVALLDEALRGVGPRPSNSQVLQVAAAGSLYRLSARLLLGEATAKVLVLDFTGVMDVGEEFLDEVFVRYAGAHPGVTLSAVNVPAALEPAVHAFTRRPASGELVSG